jgi:group II intron reverse transcriptase/maturase
MSLRPPETVEKLQKTLHAKAKECPGYRFYSLYDKVYRADVLAYAYRCSRANGGVPGVDGVTFEDIEAYGRERWLGELAEELREKTYRADAVRRAYVPKDNGQQRPLGIPTIRDRVVETAATVVLEPIFEADLQPEQYAYRAERSALDAVRHVHKLVNSGHRQVVDGDLSGYFDSIPHAELLKSVARRISDKQVLRLIKMWLTAPVEEEDGRGRKHPTTRNRDMGRGTPQGSPISPLLSNLYMRRFALGWKVLGYAGRLDAHVVNYADDFVICCRGTAAEAGQAMRAVMAKLKLTVNEAKTRVCRGPDEPFDFLGYTIGWCYSSQTGRRYIGTRPSRKKVRHVCAVLSELTHRRGQNQTARDLVRRLNQTLRGWANYFCLGPVSKAYAAVDAHARKRLRQWLGRKHSQRGRCTSRYPDEYLYERLGLVKLPALTTRLPWAKA